MKLLDYYPRFLQEVQDIRVICEAEQPEVETFSGAVQTMAKEFSVYTAGEYGIGRLERQYRISPQAGQSLEDRRKAILAKILSMLPYTVTRIIEIVTQISGAECEIKVEPALYKFTVKILKDSISSAVMAVVNEQVAVMKPANMLYLLALRVDNQSPARLRAGAMHTTAHYITVHPYMPSEISGEAIVRAVGLAAVGIKIKV